MWIMLYLRGPRSRLYPLISRELRYTVQNIIFLLKKKEHREETSLVLTFAGSIGVYVFYSNMIKLLVVGHCISSDTHTHTQNASSNSLCCSLQLKSCPSDQALLSRNWKKWKVMYNNHTINKPEVYCIKGKGERHSMAHLTKKQLVNILLLWLKSIYATWICCTKKQS